MHFEPPPGDVAFLWSNMIAKHGKWQEMARPAHDRMARPGVVIVAGPDAASDFNHGVVCPATSRRTALYRQIGASAANAIDQRVKRQRLFVHNRAPFRTTWMLDIAVHIPLDVGNIEFLDERSDPLEQVVADFRARQIQWQLVAGGN